MPTPRQRWPVGAEDHRVEALRLADLSDSDLERQYTVLDRLLREAGPHLPDTYRDLLDEAHKIAARVQTRQVRIGRTLEQARNGTDGTSPETEPRASGTDSHRHPAGRRRP